MDGRVVGNTFVLFNDGRFVAETPSGFLAWSEAVDRATIYHEAADARKLALAARDQLKLERGGFPVVSIFELKDGWLRYIESAGR